VWDFFVPLQKNIKQIISHRESRFLCDLRQQKTRIGTNGRIGIQKRLMRQKIARKGELFGGTF
jgi:hypothetical protein